MFLFLMLYNNALKINGKILLQQNKRLELANRRWRHIYTAYRFFLTKRRLRIN